MADTVMFGGSFNPVHFGHVRLLESLLKLDTVESVLVVPAAVSPFKTGFVGAGESDRLEMCRLAFAGFDRVRVDDIEFSLPTPSYTVSTLKALKRRYTGKSFGLLMGSDAALSLEKWKDYREILKTATIYTAVREGAERKTIERKLESLSNEGGRFVLMDMPRIDISSTVVRERIGRGLPVDQMIPHDVEQYIKKHGLYRG